MNSPFIFARAETTDPPRLGNDTREILSALGLDNNELAQLSDQGVISLQVSRHPKIPASMSLANTDYFD